MLSLYLNVICLTFYESKKNMPKSNALHFHTNEVSMSILLSAEYGKNFHNWFIHFKHEGNHSFIILRKLLHFLLHTKSVSKITYFHPRVLKTRAKIIVFNLMETSANHSKRSFLSFISSPAACVSHVDFGRLYAKIIIKYDINFHSYNIKCYVLIEKRW